jgi:cytochrome c5
VELDTSSVRLQADGRPAKAGRYIWVAAIVLAAAGFASAQDTSTDKGEQIQNAACLNCHDLRPIQTASYDKAGWTMAVDSMIEKGAEVNGADKPLLVDFLTRNHGPLPDGPGKAILLNTCTVCHDLGRVRIHTVSREEWEETLLTMLNEGAMLSDQDFPVLLNYLARNFRQ